MDEQLKQIGERLRGLRDVLDIPVSEMAETIGINAEKYEKIEAGELDITISNLMKICLKILYHILLINRRFNYG